MLLESQLAGRFPIGADSNPLARLITSVKTCPIRRRILDSAAERLFDQLPNEPTNCPPDVVNLEYWFYPHVIRQLQCLREAIDTTPRADIRDFFRVCFSNCVKRVSLTDPRLTVPVRLKQGQYPIGHSLRHKSDSHLLRLRRVNVLDEFTNVLTSNLDRLASLEPFISGLPPASLVSTDARHLEVNTASGAGDVQLVITSPPYPGAQKYIRSSSLSLGWLGFISFR